MALLVILFLAFRREPVRVEAAPVTRGPMSATIQDRGQTRVLDRYVISSPVAGTLERIPFQAGESVKAGEIVARIAPSSLSAVGSAQARAAVGQAEAAVRAAQANVGSAQARADLAAKEYRRLAASHAQGIVSTAGIRRRPRQLTTPRSAMCRRPAPPSRKSNASLASARAALLALIPAAPA